MSFSLTRKEVPELLTDYVCLKAPALTFWSPLTEKIATVPLTVGVAFFPGLRPFLHPLVEFMTQVKVCLAEFSFWI